MRSAVITGCTGEIGNALVRLLLAQGWEVHAVCRPNSRRSRFLLQADRLRILECDLFDLASAAQALPEKCGVFFHLGWHASYGAERLDPYGQARNILAALDAVNLAAKLGCSVFVGAGSQAQYGDTEETLTPETSMRPSTAYGAAKLCAEQMTRELCATKGIRHVWGRVVSVYGPCDGPHTLITYLMRTQLRGEEAILTPCGQYWDFLYAEDTARAFLSMAESGKDGQPYCVASGSCRPLHEYMHDFQHVLGGKAKLHIGGKSYTPNQRMRLCADISTLRADTGFAPLVPFLEGIERTWQWYAQHPEALTSWEAE